MLKKFFNIFISSVFLMFYKSKRIKVDMFSNFHYKNLKNKNFNGTKDYPITIKNSSVGAIEGGEGCKIINSMVSHNVKLGKFVSINGPGTRIAASNAGIEIGSFTSIASNVVIQEYYHRYHRLSSYYIFQNVLKEGVEKDIFSKGKIKIEEDVWIGSNCVLLSGITVGRGSIIAAGSIVTKDIPRYTIVAGNPGKVIKKRFDDKIINLLEEIKWWEWEVEKIHLEKELFEVENQNNLYERLLLLRN